MDLQAVNIINASSALGAVLCIGLGAIGAAYGESYAAQSANIAISKRAEMSGDIVKNMLVGQAVAESAAIFALVVAVILIFTPGVGENSLPVFSMISAGLCMGLGAIGAGVGAGFPAGAACDSMVRQPAISGQISTNMLLGSAVCQTPAIFALVISFLLIFMNFDNLPIWPAWAAIIAAGISTGLGSIGSGLGGGLIAKASCEGIARQPGAGGPITTNMLVGQAVAQTPVIFATLVSFVLLFKSYAPATTIAPAAALLGAGLSMGLGAIGPGLGNGLVGEKAVEWISKASEEASTLSRTMLIGQAVSQSTAIYAMVISLVLIFVV